MSDPVASDAPVAPVIPEAPQAPEAPEAPEVPEAPGAPGAPEAPEAPVTAPKLICTIKLKDDSIIEVRDQRLIDHCKTLGHMAGVTEGQSTQVSILQFEPRRVRYVLEHLIPFVELTEGNANFKEAFSNTGYFAEGQQLGLHEILLTMEVADFLDSWTALRGLGVIAAHLMLSKRGVELCEMFGYPPVFEGEEQQEVKTQCGWFMPRLH